MRNHILQFIDYRPVVYSGFDKFNVMVAEKLKKEGFRTVFVFFDSLDSAPDFRKDIEKAGGEYVFLPSRQGFFSRMFSMMALFRKYKPYAVHVHFINQIKILSAILSPFFPFRLFISFHSKIWDGTAAEYRAAKGYLKFQMLRLYLYILAKRSEMVFCVSEAVKNQFEIFVKAKNVMALYLGVKRPTVTREQAMEKMGFAPDDPTVRLCNVSAIEELKGLDLIIKALAALKKDPSLPPFKFYHIGGSRSGECPANKAFEEKITAMKKQYAVEDIFCMLGKRYDIMDILPAFDIYVHPSRSEGLSVAVMEAMACNLAVICTNVGGMPEIVKDMESGFLIEKDNVEQLTERMKILIKDKSLRIKILTRGGVYVEKQSGHGFPNGQTPRFLSKAQWWDKFDIDILTGHMANVYLNDDKGKYHRK